MKILHVVPAYEPAWALGGPVVSTSLLCRELVSLGVDVTVYTTNCGGKDDRLDVKVNEPISLGGVKVFYFPCNFQKKRAYYSRLLNDKIAATASSFDLVHASSVWQYHQVIVEKVCKKNNIPYIVSPRGSFQEWPLSQNRTMKIIYWLLFGKGTIRNASALHFTAKMEKEESLGFIPDVPSFIVPNGIEIQPVNSFNSHVRREVGVPNDAFLLLSMGRVNRKKGIDLVIKALGILKNKNIFLLIVGNADDKEYYIHLKKLVSGLGLENNVIFWGPVSREDTRYFYKASDLFVLTSYSENFANAVAEAMSFGVPVLISRKVAIWREVEGDCAGVTVEINEEDIAQKINRIINDLAKREEVAQNARNCALNRYDIKKVALQMINAYEDVLTGMRTKELQWD